MKWHVRHGRRAATFEALADAYVNANGREAKAEARRRLRVPVYDMREGGASWSDIVQAVGWDYSDAEGRLQFLYFQEDAERDPALQITFRNRAELGKKVVRARDNQLLALGQDRGLRTRRRRQRGQRVAGQGGVRGDDRRFGGRQPHRQGRAPGRGLERSADHQGRDTPSRQGRAGQGSRSQGQGSGRARGTDWPPPRHPHGGRARDSGQAPDGAGVQGSGCQGQGQGSGAGAASPRTQGRRVSEGGSQGRPKQARDAPLLAQRPVSLSPQQRGGALLCASAR